MKYCIVRIDTLCDMISPPFVDTHYRRFRFCSNEELDEKIRILYPKVVSWNIHLDLSDDPQEILF